MVSDFQKRKLTHVFSTYDTDKSGLLERKDFEASGFIYARMLGAAPNSPEEQAIVNNELHIWDSLQKICDFDADGKITPEEYITGFSTWMTTDRPSFEGFLVSYLNDVFTSIDRNGDGKISEEEFTSVMYSEDQTQGKEVFSLLDTDGNGSLSKDEMLQHWQEFFFGDNPNHPSKWIFGKFE